MTQDKDITKDIDFIWIDNEAAGITCVCGAEIIVSPYEKTCRCGRRLIAKFDIRVYQIEDALNG